MEMSQGISLYNYLKQTKMSFFYKNGEKEVRIVPVWGVGTSVRGNDVKKVCRRGNTVKILFTNACKW
jgi:hypothetical protein